MKIQTVLFCCLLAMGCSKKDTTVLTVPPNIPAPPVTPILTETPVTVYVAVSGWINSGQNVGKYWKDSIPTFVSDSTKSETVTGIAVSGQDIYLSGYLQGTYWPFAQYWKNGVVTKLTDSASTTTGIAVSGNDVYVSGYIYGQTTLATSFARYWKNGVPVALEVGTAQWGYTSGIVVSGSDVYVSGYSVNPAPGGGYTSIAMYWKNGVRVNVTDGTKFAEANGIAVSGNDVYVAGVESDPPNTNGIARYWKNGVQVSLTDGTTPTALSGICISGTDVYAVGNITIGTTGEIAAYWKNGNPVYLSQTTSQTGYANANALVISGNDVYVAGRMDYFPVYWKNGVAVPLKSGKLNDNGMGIVVVPK